MADYLLHSPPSYNLKLRSQHQPPSKTLLKIRRLLRIFISRHASRIAAALGGARSMLLDILNKKAGIELRRKMKRRRRRRRSNIDSSCGGGSIAMHLNLLPPGGTPEMAVLEPLETGLSYYVPSWNTVIPAQLQPLPIAGYLEWPDEDVPLDDWDDEEDGGGGCNEIDRMAERFIVRCHERFSEAGVIQEESGDAGQELVVQQACMRRCF